ncbi:MAG: hypothetical protein WC777_02640 [Candidatus Gracilibacteria bacterium]
MRIRFLFLPLLFLLSTCSTQVQEEAERLKIPDYGFALEADMSECGRPNAVLNFDVDRWFSYVGEQAVFFARVDGISSEGDSLRLEWVVKGNEHGMVKEDVFLYEEELEVKQCPDGNLYASSPLDSGTENSVVGIFGGFTAQLFQEDELVYSAHLSLGQ